MKVQMVTRDALRKRGWTKKMFDTLLGPPDKEVDNPYRRAGPRCKLFCLARVQLIEQTCAFRAANILAEKRRGAAGKATRTKLAQTEQLVERLVPPKFPTRTKERLRQLAIKHYNTLWAERGEDRCAAVNDSDEFLDRITCNYLRHECSAYEEQCERVYGRVGKGFAYNAIRKRIHDAIREAYPWLNRSLLREEEGNEP